MPDNCMCVKKYTQRALILLIILCLLVAAIPRPEANAVGGSINLVGSAAVTAAAEAAGLSASVVAGGVIMLAAAAAYGVGAHYAGSAAPSAVFNFYYKLGNDYVSSWSDVIANTLITPDGRLYLNATDNSAVSSGLTNATGKNAFTEGLNGSLYGISVPANTTPITGSLPFYTYLAYGSTHDISSNDYVYYITPTAFYQVYVRNGKIYKTTNYSRYGFSTTPGTGSLEGQTMYTYAFFTSPTGSSYKSLGGWDLWLTDARPYLRNGLVNPQVLKPDFSSNIETYGTNDVVINGATVDDYVSYMQDTGVLDYPDTNLGDYIPEPEPTALPSNPPYIPPGLDIPSWTAAPGYDAPDIPQSLEDTVTDVLPKQQEAIQEKIDSIGEILTGADVNTETEEEQIKYTRSLKEFFPFCLPFDLYNLLAQFNSSRESPYFEIPFDTPWFSYTFVLDGSQFDSLAYVLRGCEVVVFAIGLILLTRKMIWK